MNHSATQNKYQTRVENALSKCAGSAQPSSGASRRGGISPADVLNDEGNVAAKIRLFAFLKNCPGVGSAGARTLLRALGLSETKTIRSLGPVQKARILTVLEMIAGGVRVDRVAEIIMSER